MNKNIFISLTDLTNNVTFEVYAKKLWTDLHSVYIESVSGKLSKFELRFYKFSVSMESFYGNSY